MSLPAVRSDQVPDLLEEVRGLGAERLLEWAARRFAGQIVFASSLGMEDQVLTDMIARLGLDIPIFTLDTGRLFPETYDLLARTEERYGLGIELRFPDRQEVEEMVARDGVNLFRKSVELRKHCCAVRKIHPLRRALEGRGAWLVGLRAEQSVTRTTLEPVAWDEANGLVKLSPMADWSAAQVEAYIHDHEVPVNPLHAQGFPSIGCACCTRAVAPGEDIRAGRWWWEQPEHKECGLHGRFTKSRPEYNI